jgi:predicted nucleic acid-binding protein
MTNPLVIDAGLVFRALLPNPAQAALQELIGGWQDAGRDLCAPTLWLYELTSAIAKGVHFAAITEPEGRRTLALANRLSVQLIAPDAAMALAAYDWTRRLKRAAAYDSFYLALAESLSCEFWTSDRHLQTAAGMPWVRVPEAR